MLGRRECAEQDRLQGLLAMFSGVEPLQVAAWRLVCGQQPTDELPGLATDPLVRGVDSSALRELAGIAPGDPWTILSLFERTVEELGLQCPDVQVALWRLAQHEAEEVTSGRVTPIAGARWIWAKVYSQMEMGGDLRIFVGLASEWEDAPAYRKEIEAGIVAAAERIVGQDQPRTWVRLQAREGRSPVAYSGDLREFPVENLPVGRELIEDIKAWASSGTTERSPETSGTAVPEDRTAFRNRGAELVERLNSELGQGWWAELA